MAELLKAPVGSRRLKVAKNPIKYRLVRIKYRADKQGIEFDLKPEDIYIPKTCPLLDIPLIICTDSGGKKGGLKEPGLWTVDRKDPTKGYTPDNIWVISLKANTIKNNATLEELETLVTNMRQRM